MAEQAAHNRWVLGSNPSRPISLSLMKPKNKIAGSSNIDFVVQVRRFPTADETVLGNDFMMARGGIGVNQFAAAARLGVVTP
jgi:hypothetical protein